MLRCIDMEFCDATVRSYSASRVVLDPSQIRDLLCYPLSAKHAHTDNKGIPLLINERSLPYRHNWKCS